MRVTVADGMLAVGFDGERHVLCSAVLDDAALAGAAQTAVEAKAQARVPAAREDAAQTAVEATTRARVPAALAGAAQTAVEAKARARVPAAHEAAR